MSLTFCLDCEHEISMGFRPTVGKRVICPNCGVKLEVISVEPIKLDWIYDGPVANLGMFDNLGRTSPPNATQR